MTVGRFQPFTQGHLNMVNEGEAPCIVYQIKPAEVPADVNAWKISGKKVKKADIQAAIDYISSGCKVDITELQKEILKRPFTNELVAKELDELKKSNKNIVDVVYVKNVFDALDRFNAFCTEHKDEYEPQYWMCGDDRVDDYNKNIDKYDELESELGKGDSLPNILKGVLKTNTGKGRTEGISGTAVRKCLILKDKNAFAKVMPKEVSNMFDTFCGAFDEFKDKLASMIKECKMVSLTDFINENLQ